MGGGKERGRGGGSDEEGGAYRVEKRLLGREVVVSIELEGRKELRA